MTTAYLMLTQGQPVRVVIVGSMRQGDYERLHDLAAAHNQALIPAELAYAGDSGVLAAMIEPEVIRNPTRRFYQKVVIVEALSETMFPADIAIDDLVHQGQDGGYSVDTAELGQLELDGYLMARMLRAQYAEPTYFRLDDHGFHDDDVQDDPADDDNHGIGAGLAAEPGRG